MNLQIIDKLNYTDFDEDIFNANNPTLRVEYWFAVKEESLKYLTTKDRTIFFAIFLSIYTVSFFSNIYAIYVTIKRQHRWIQKTCTISLCLTDLITATAYTINYLETFSHPLVNWTLGSFMCTFIPLVQIFGVTASSAALVAIALDRYRNVIHVLNKKWNPQLWLCLFGVFLTWASSAAIAYPMFLLFDQKRVIVAYYDENGKPKTHKQLYMCISDKKETLKIYYICITLLIFMPLICIFAWLYYNVAKLIWKHRKPLSARNKKEISATETSTSQIKSNEDDTSKISMPAPKPKSVLPRVKSIHVERKIRTFKIIITLMMVFIGCRLPYHIFNIEKLVNSHKEHEYWIMVYIFNGLGLLNTALNPFLYTFLYPTLNFAIKVHKTVTDFICKVCCCCFSNTEFEDFEKANPFVVENFEKKPISNKNYLNKRNSRIKLEDGKSKNNLQLHDHNKF